MAQETKDTQQAKVQVPTVTLTIDGRQTSVPKGTTVLEAATAMGIHIPTFCWHPKLKPVGACRMCYVQIEKMPKLAVSCATEAMEGMVVYTDSDQVKQGRKAIIEFILLNHPLDCPTCDKGGECDLQNLTFRHGIDDSRFAFQKYRFTEGTAGTTFDDKRIGPEIVLNRNRCILCYKCVRANKEAFGEFDLGVYERGNIAEINSAPGEQVDNPFSGNLVEICPVGALTNTDWRYKIRVWLTKTTPSICNYTSSGTNILFYKEDHHNRIYRSTSRRNDAIDDGWLPDVCRYGYQIANSEERLTKPLIKKDGRQVEATWEEALNLIGKRLGEITETKGRVCIAGLASAHLDNAALHAFSKYFRTVLGSNNIDYRTDYRMLPTDPKSPYTQICRNQFTIADIDTSDVIVTIGSDLLREHQNEYLRIRKAYNFNRARYFSLMPYAVKSADVAEAELIYKIGTEEILLGAICLAGIEMGLVDASRATGLKEKISPRTLAEAATACGVPVDDIKLLARAIAGAKRITLFGGELITRSHDRDIIAAAMHNLNRLFGLTDKGQMTVLSRYANSCGAERLGLLPRPAKAVIDKMTELWGSFPEAEPRTTDQMFVQMRKEEIDGLIIMGANPVMLYPDRQFVTECLEKLDFLVVADLFETATTELADVVLPMSSFAEYAGNYTNLEGRVQTAQRAIKPVGQSRSPFEIVKAIAKKFDVDLFESDDLMEKEVAALLATETSASLPDEYLEVTPLTEENNADYPIPVLICDDPHHCGHWTEKSPSLMNFCAEAYIEMSPDLAAKYSLRTGDPVRVESEVGKVIVPTRISEHIDNDVVLLPRNFASTNVNALLMRKKRTDRVKISKVVD